MKPIQSHRFSHLLASLVGLALACQRPSGGGNESRAQSTATSAAARTSPKSSEPAEPVQNTTASALDEDTPAGCAATEFNYPVVKAACAEGGRGAAKKIMSGAIANAKRAGVELKCSNCHVDQKTFGLRPNAVDDLAQWL